MVGAPISGKYFPVAYLVNWHSLFLVRYASSTKQGKGPLLEILKKNTKLEVCFIQVILLQMWRQPFYEDNHLVLNYCYDIGSALLRAWEPKNCNGLQINHLW